ncbi:MAG: hypothetical protein ACYDBB_27070 [Armatimonadota bacterium]
MTRRRILTAMLVLVGAALALLTIRLDQDRNPPPSWTQLQRWAGTARPGELHTGLEGILLARACVTSRTPTPYTFHWLLPGGSYGDQDFMLIPLGEGALPK